MPFNEQQQKELDLKRVQEHVDQLATKFETVHVFATRYDPTNRCTVSVDAGAGNWLTRRGQIHEWSVKRDEINRQEALEELDE